MGNGDGSDVGGEVGILEGFRVGVVLALASAMERVVRTTLWPNATWCPHPVVGIFGVRSVSESRRK